MIETHDLSKQFGDFLAVDAVNLDVQEGQVLALLGPNGAGKTTTVRLLTSILRPTRGWARVAGYDVRTHPAQVRASVGVLTEQHGLYNRMPAGEYLDFFGQLYGLAPERRSRRIDDLLEKFGLGGEKNRRLGEFSKGMSQKLALARALLHEPPVLLLDEPTSAMDPESARMVRNAIRALRKEDRAIIICTHNLLEAEDLADQIAIIQRGRIVASGSPVDLKLRLLGPAEFEVRLGVSLNGARPSLPKSVQLKDCGDTWLRYTTEKPEAANPTLLRSLLDQGFPVLGLSEVPRSLEQVYLQAIGARGDS